jgi:23S rRNA (guanosine2251-2'-O)-methyltransferase
MSVKRTKTYAHGKHAVSEAQRYAPESVLKVFEDERGNPIAQISLSRLIKPYADFAASLASTPDTLLVLLAGLEDPHNVGAIIRSAAAFGAGAVLMPSEGQAPITDAVLKVSAGMAFRIPLVSMGGYQQTLSDLHKRGFKIYGLEAKGAPLNDEAFAGSTVLVLGNEGEGLPGAVRPLCDGFLAIPMHARAESLNVAAAAAAALFAWSSRHPGALE